MEKIRSALHATFKLKPSTGLLKIKFDPMKMVYPLITFSTFLLIWHLAASYTDNPLLLPTPWLTLKAFIFAVQDAETLRNLALTLRRVIAGLGIAMAIGLSLGFAMGCSNIICKLVDPVIGPLRQVPIMAWVPLTIVWFGLGDGPTLFIIAMVGTFPVLLNTMAGVRSVPQNYYHAARSMGAGRFVIFSRITLPSALPDMITGLRIGLSAGWMSVI